LQLKLDLLSQSDIQNLIVSLDVWAGGMDSFPALLEARSRLLPVQAETNTGYTALWEEELTRRFGPTNFVPLEPNQTVRAFTVERQLAFGGFSAIYLVFDGGRNRFVLKEAVIPPDGDEDKRAQAELMFAREAAILASLNHPNLVKVNDSFVEEGRHYILMEYIEGEDLRRLIKEHGAQGEKDVLFWADQLLAILSYLHSQAPPVIHRDISPDNLMLSETGELVVIDFGAANHFAGTATGTLIGKQAYIAPEQLRGKAEPRSDLYAFGCTLHFLLTGNEPEPLDVSHPKQLVPGISSELDEIIAQCTAQETEDRPHSANEIRISLQKLKEFQRV
jgi:serine/threonine protein kinase, bacterial